jgi:hypothetical protein
MTNEVTINPLVVALGPEANAVPASPGVEGSSRLKGL